MKYIITIHVLQYYIVLNFQFQEHLFMEFILLRANLQDHGITYKQIVQPVTCT